jgi:hypothetical protein
MIAVRDSCVNGVCRLHPADAGFVGHSKRQEESMARKSRGKRREEQRKRQAEIRADANEKCRPDRDDFARMLLWLTFQKVKKTSQQRGASGPVDQLAAILIDNLVRQGFDAEEAGVVFEDIFGRYSGAMMPFRIKRHLGKTG